AWDGLTSFSLLPLRIATMAGAVAALLGAVSGVWGIVAGLAWGPALHRTAALIATMLVLGGLQLLALGVLGEYVGRLFEEIKRRPIYVVDHTLGFAGDGGGGAAPGRGPRRARAPDTGDRRSPIPGSDLREDLLEPRGLTDRGEVIVPLE